MQNLLPKEEVKEQVNCECNLKGEGILLLTNTRLLWKRVGETFFEGKYLRMNLVDLVNESLLNLKSARGLKDPNQANRYLINVLFDNKNKYLLKFSGVESEIVAARVEAVLKNNPDRDKIKQNSIGRI